MKQFRFEIFKCLWILIQLFKPERAVHLIERRINLTCAVKAA